MVGGVDKTGSLQDRQAAALCTADGGALATAEPMNPAMNSTDTTLTAAPPSASANVAGRQVTRWRTATPAMDASNCPSTAVTKTTIKAATAC